MTWELRRDPKERKAERDRKEADQIIQDFLKSSESQQMQFSDGVTTKTIDLSQFQFTNNGSN